MAESDDEQLELKKRARRRLVGATALVLLAAIVLPMVMEHEPRPPVQDIQVRIPGQDVGGFTSRILPAQATPTPLPPVTPAVETKPLAAARPAAAMAESPQEKPAKPAEKPVQNSPAPIAVEQTATETSSEATRAASALAGTTTDQWVVQLGAYREAGNVKLRLAKLKELGVPVYTEKIDSPQGPRTRVRAGPFPSREAAEKARVKIRIIGIDGPVAPK